MTSNGGSWAQAWDSAGMCFGGTYCAGNMTRAPDLNRDACSAGYYCPAGTATMEACSPGTYNPFTGKNLTTDCLVTLAGYYSIAASVNMTGLCDAGYYCPAGSSGLVHLSALLVTIALEMVDSLRWIALSVWPVVIVLVEMFNQMCALKGSIALRVYLLL